MKQINNELFNKEYENIDNIKIINKAKKRFKKNIPHDELERCGLYGLWNALKMYNQEKKMKFTSYLYQTVIFECLDWLNENKIETRPYKPKSIIYEHIFFDEFKDYISILPNELADIVESVIVYGHSLRKISKEKNMKYYEVDKKLQKAYRMLQQHVNRTIFR